MRRLALLIAALSLLAFGAGAGAAAGLRGAPPPPFPTLPGNWSHAEINVKIKRSVHTLILDRGRITQASTTQLTLREADGSVVPVTLSPDTIITLGRFTVTPNVVRRGMWAEAMAIDGGAAVRVRLSLRP